MGTAKPITPALQAVLQAEAQRAQAMREGDVAALQALLSDDMVYVHSSAVSDSKSSYLAKLRSGAMRYLALQLDDLQALQAGDAVVVTGRMQAEVLKDGQVKPVRSVFMTVWAAQTDAHGAPAWTLRAHQGTPLPA